MASPHVLVSGCIVNGFIGMFSRRCSRRNSKKSDFQPIEICCERLYDTLIKGRKNMKTIKINPILSVLLILVLVQIACGASAVQPTSTPAPTDTPQPTATISATPTNTPRPSPTPRPTKTPNLAATQRMDEFNAEAQSYFDKGYIKTTAGEIKEYDDFAYDWAQINYYNWLPLNETVSDFYISAHFKWESAFRNANISGCGIAFAIQENGDHYAVFLDRSQILFLSADQTSSFSRKVGLTRGTGKVKFDNPADAPQEADFTLIVGGTYAYVLVDGELVGQYTLSQSKALKGDIGLSVLSGTNKDFGTRCAMTKIHAWFPSK
jgi:hypothetical protein